MTIENEIEYVDLFQCGDLIGYFEPIAALFQECFGKPIPKDLWEWAYVNNPCGLPFVSLALLGGKVVGHYAVIPMPYVVSGAYIDGYLSMTTMVASDCRRLGLFQKLAQRVFDAVEKKGEAAIVYGFPNNQSAPGFRKRLGWEIDDSYKVITISDEQWPSVVGKLESCIDDDPVLLDLKRKDFIEWRSNKPGQRWSFERGVGVKTINGGGDLMCFGEVGCLVPSLVAKGRKLNLIVRDTLGEFNEAFEYRFGYRTFNWTSPAPNFLLCMAMSDIF